jgi:hypothetical protein
MELLKQVLDSVLAQGGFLSLVVWSGFVLPWLLLTLLGMSVREKRELFLPLFGFGSILLAWSLEVLVRVFSHQSDRFYLWALVALLAVISGIGRKELRQSFRCFGKVWGSLIRGVMKGSELDRFIALSIVGVWILNLYSTQFSTLRGSDELEYATVARIIHENASFENYPFKSADPATGYFWPATHPVTFISLHNLGYLFQSNVSSVVGAKLVSCMFYGFGLLSMLFLPGKFSIRARLIGTLLYATIPCLYNLSISKHIDPVYVYSFTLPFVVLLKISRPVRKRDGVVMGVMIAAPATVHSAGILVLPFVLGTIVLENVKDLRRIIAPLVVLIGIAVMIGGPHYLKNYLSFGSPVGNPVINASGDAAIDHVSATASDRGLETFKGRLLFGVLRPWYNLLDFGVVPFLFLILLFCRFRSVCDSIAIDSRMRLMLIPVFLLVLMYSVAAVINHVAPIQNSRYQLVLLPFMIGFVMLILQHNRETGADVASRRRIGFVVILALGLTGLKGTLLNVKYNIRGDYSEIVSPKGTDVYRCIEWLKKHGDPSAGKVLVFRPGEAGYYLENYKLLCPDDPTFQPVYHLKDWEHITENLRERGVAYILVSFDERNFYVNKTELIHYLQDPEVVELMYSYGTYSVLTLKVGETRKGMRLNGRLGSGAGKSGVSTAPFSIDT